MSEPGVMFKTKIKTVSSIFRLHAAPLILAGSFAVGAVHADAPTYTGQFNALESSQIEQKKTAAMLASNNDPWPGIDTDPGKSSFVATSYGLNINTERADEIILALTEVPFFWSAPFVAVFANEQYSQRMSPAAFEHLSQLFFNMINGVELGTPGSNAGSHLADARLRLTFDGSENLSAKKRSIFYLAAQTLAKNPAYAGRTLAQGGTIEQHAEAWETYWKNYFRDWAMHGLEIEMNSGSYVKYTFAIYFNIYSATDDLTLKALARQYLDLIIADKAQAHLPNAAVTAGAQARAYKRNSYLMSEAFGHYPSLYGWNDNNISGFAVSNSSNLSDYRTPDVIVDLARNKTGLFDMQAGSMGALASSGGGVNQSNFFQLLDLDQNGRGGVTRFTTMSDSFGMGTMFYSPEFSNWSTIARQNRKMGIHFDTNVNAQILVNGIGTAQGDEQTGYDEIIGVGQKGAQLIWTDHRVNNNTGTRIFVADGLHEKGVQRGQWWFVQEGNAYFGMRLANGTWEVTDRVGGLGQYFVLNDRWSPVIMEAAEASDYASFEAFQDAMLNNAVTYRANHTTYTSEAGIQFDVFPGKAKFARIDGENVGLSATEPTYQSPYISGMAPGDETVIVSSPSGLRMTLDFGLNGFRYEAEAAEYSTRDWESVASSAASGGEYLRHRLAEGAPASPGALSYAFDVPRDGTYAVYAKVLTPDGGSNSFFVNVNGTEDFTWHTTRNNQLTWERVGTLRFDLEAGRHILFIKPREQGAGIDEILITEDFGFTGATAQLPVVSPVIQECPSTISDCILDRDGDGVPDSEDTFPDDATESIDTDGDGVGDNGDAFPNDPTESADSDGDGVGDNSDPTPGIIRVVQIEERSTGYCGVDGVIESANAGFSGDGYSNTENVSGAGMDWQLRGEAGTYRIAWRYALRSGARPAGVLVNGQLIDTVTFSSTGDWVNWATSQSIELALPAGVSSVRLQADESNGLPNIDFIEVMGPSAAAMVCGEEIADADTDGDGVPDSEDAFPNDASEIADSDGDGTGDNADAFPADATETEDTDGDGVGDNTDAFPADSSETKDTDGDGVGDNSDAYPNDPTRSAETPVAGGPITIDGDLSDWVGVSSFGVDAQDISGANNPLDWKEAWMKHDGSFLYLAYEHYREVSPSWGQTLYLDTDLNSTTGFQNGMAIGADYVLRADYLYRYAGDGSNWQWDFVAQVASAYTPTVAEMRIEQSSLGTPAQLRVTFVGGNTAYEGGTAEDLYPDGLYDTSASVRYFEYSNTAPSNTAPMVQDQLVTTQPGVPVEFTLVASDVNGDALSYEVVSDVSHGLITGTAPALSYTPPVEFSGTDSLSYRVSDGSLNSTLASVTFSVSPVNRFQASNEVSSIEPDGLLSDWAGYASFSLDAAEGSDNNNPIDWREAWLGHDESRVYLAYRFNDTLAAVPLWTLNVFIDTDQNFATGYSAGASIGADYLLQGQTLYRHSGADGKQWRWDVVSAVPGSLSGSSMELVVARQWLNDPQAIDLYFAGDNVLLGGNRPDYYPDGVFDTTAAVRAFSYSMAGLAMQGDEPTIGAAESSPIFSRQTLIDNGEYTGTSGGETKPQTKAGSMGLSLLLPGALLAALRRRRFTRYAVASFP